MVQSHIFHTNNNNYDAKDHHRTSPRQISFRVTNKQYEKLAERAARQGISPTRLARKLVLHPRKQKIMFTPEDTIDIRKRLLAIAKEFNQMGRNLNQVAFKLNQTGEWTKETQDNVRVWLKKYETKIQKIFSIFEKYAGDR